MTTSRPNMGQDGSKTTTRSPQDRPRNHVPTSMHPDTCTEYKLSRYQGLTRPAILRNKLFKYLCLARPAVLKCKLSNWNTSYLDTWAWRRQAILEYKLSEYLRLAATKHPWNTSSLGTWACAATKHPWNTSYLGTWAWQHQHSWNTSYPSIWAWQDEEILEYKLSRHLGLGGDPAILN